MKQNVCRTIASRSQMLGTLSPFVSLPIEVWATLPSLPVLCGSGGSAAAVPAVSARPKSGMRFSALQLLAGVPRVPPPSPQPPMSALPMTLMPLLSPQAPAVMAAGTRPPPVPQQQPPPELSVCLDSMVREAAARAVLTLLWPSLSLGVELRRPLLLVAPPFPAAAPAAAVVMPAPLPPPTHRSTAVAPGAAFALGAAWQAARGCQFRARAGSRGAAISCDLRWDCGPGAALLASAFWSSSSSSSSSTGAQRSNGTASLSLSAYARA